MKLNRLPRVLRSKQRLLSSASAARPVLVEPLENRQMLSLTVEVRTLSGGTTASATTVGQVINLEVLAVVSGSTSGVNDGLDSVCGSFLSSETSQPNSVAGNMAAFLTKEYTANGAAEGAIVDLNGDGNLDVGSNNNTDIAGFFNARAGGILQDGTVSGNTMTFEIATLNYTVTNLHYGSATDVNFRWRDGVPSGAFDGVWLEDGGAQNDQTGTVLVGSPLVITDPNLSPPTGVISGTVDKSVSGVTSAFSGTTVYLDINQDGTLDAGDFSTTTASDGSYSFTGLSQGTYLLREVVPSGYTQTSPASTPTSVTLSSNNSSITGQNFVDTASVSSLQGAVIGTAGSYQNDGNTIAKAFDGSLSTYFDGPTASGNWAGLNLGSQFTISQLSYSPRANWAGRMVGGIFQGSNDPNFVNGVTNLATITTTPTVGVYTSMPISNTNAFEYVRYLSPANSWGDVAELQFYGTAATTTNTASISGTISKVVNGSTSAFSGVTVYLDTNDNGFLNSGESATTTSSSGTYSFIGLAAGTYHLREIVPSGYTQTSPSSSPTDVTVGTTAVSGENFTDTAVTTSGSLLSGTVIGTAGSYQNDGNTIAKAFDGSLSTYFDGPTASGNWAGRNLGAQYTITQINYSPRVNWAGRMVGGIFQGSNDPNFVNGVVNLATITTTPTVGVYTPIPISNTSTFQYVRYLSPANSWGDVAEIQFYGIAAAHPKLSGTVIGTAGSYQNDGNTIAKAFDGSLSTYFDGPTANGNWAGLDLGTAHSIGQISYAPRANWAGRMVGGIFQASNTADFSSGVVNLFTITATPPYNALSTVGVSASGTYRYVRYLSPANSWGDVSEVQFFG